jgi:predicted NAD/FAD-binding protein
MSTAEARLDAVAKATALIDEALAVLDEAEVRNGRVLGTLTKARTECSMHERELMYVQQKHEERKRECRRSAS